MKAAVGRTKTDPFLLTAATDPLYGSSIQFEGCTSPSVSRLRSNDRPERAGGSVMYDGLDYQMGVLGS